MRLDMTLARAIKGTVQSNRQWFAALGSFRVSPIAEPAANCPAGRRIQGRFTTW